MKIFLNLAITMINASLTNATKSLVVSPILSSAMITTLVHMIAAKPMKVVFSLLVNSMNLTNVLNTTVTLKLDSL